ncbi:LacI family DNA-binding transcriptional regulator [Halpernia sp. GG3]
MKRITIKDIASMLQISTSTVSRALKDHPDISDKVKMRVKETAETFNYVPNDFAINFRKKSRKVIGLIIPDISMFFIPAIIKGISNTLQKQGYHFFILPSNECFETEMENIQTCINSSVDGILISLTKETKSLDHLNRTRELGIPTIIFDKTLPESTYPEVLFDNKRNTESCVELLINAGCKKIMAILGNEDLTISQSRLNYFKEKIKLYDDVEYNFIFCDSADAVKEKLGIILKYENFDGFFAMSDETLAGLNVILMDREVNFKEIKVVSISEGVLPKYLNKSYRYETNDALKMGIMAATILLNKIINENTDPAIEKHIVLS